MTALQWITTEAKKIKKAYPNKYGKWTDYVKHASALYQKKEGKKKPAAKKKKSVGDYKINKGEFVESRQPIKPRKKRLKAKKVFSVSRTKTGLFKKKGIKRIGATSTHKDTKSHNVNIRVVSGIAGVTNQSLKKIKENNEKIESLQKSILRNKETYKNTAGAKTTFWKNWYNQQNKAMSDFIKTLKKENTQLKKHIK
jgi:hypothetical protein